MKYQRAAEEEFYLRVFDHLMLENYRLKQELKKHMEFKEYIRFIFRKEKP